MRLPELIEIVPPESPLAATISVPGSKSITNRTLILAALAEGKTILEGALWSEDTQVMVECLQKLGFSIEMETAKGEVSNRTITVYGRGGAIPVQGSTRIPIDLHVRNAGTAARFLTAMVCLGQGIYRIHGVPRMHERPQAALFDALRELGYRIDSANNKLPATVYGGGPRHGSCQVSIEQSSQFASALMLPANRAGWQITVTGENAEESPYVRMTAELVRNFPARGGVFAIEPDASSCSYFWAINYLLSHTTGARAPSSRAAEVKVEPAPASDWQVDTAFRRFLPPQRPISRVTDLGDSIMTAIVMAPLFERETVYKDLGRLRLQECERVTALRTELAKCGAQVVEMGDSLAIAPSRLHGAEIETYHDHRMAMCFAVLGTRVPGIKIRNPACVRKTFPDFFQKLKAPQPEGLSLRILDGRSGAELNCDQLFAT
jgi:3-phosphoshikimate 1-carboxyvinyltransferase